MSRRGGRKSKGTTHLLLLDEDSVPAPGMVAALMEGFKQPGPRGCRWSALAR
jgi:hypothetical protein